MKTVKIIARGAEALDSAERGAKLYVLNMAGWWVPAGPSAIARGRRMLAMDDRIGGMPWLCYGVTELKVAAP